MQKITIHSTEEINSNYIREFAFVIILILINFRQTLNMLDFGTEIITFFIFIISLLSINSKHAKQSFISLFIGLSLLLIQPESFIFVQIIIIIISYSFISIKRIALYNLNIQILFFFINWMLLEYGIINEEISTDYKEGTTDLGYGNINTFSAYVYFILLSLYLLFYKQKVIYIIILVISFAIYKISGGRTYFIAELLLLISSYHIFLKHIICKYVLILFPIIIFIAIIYLIYDYSLGNQYIDIFLSGRLRYTYGLFSNFSIKDMLFGGIQDEEIIIDIAYVKIVVIGGAIALFYFLFIYYKSLPLIYKKKHYIPIIMSLLLAGMAESVFSHLQFSGGLIIWFILYKNAFERNKGILIKT